MSDQPGAGRLPELTPEQEAEVRRLLAEARHDEPIPVEVGDRLDRVLAGLTRDEPGRPGVAPVVDLAARRRRRNAAALLAGAAAVIVAGFGIGQVIDVGGTSSGDDAAGSAAAPADRESQELDSGGDAADSGGTEGDDAPSANTAAPDLPPPLVLGSDTLERDVTRQLERSAPAAQEAAPEALSAYGCTPPATGKYGLGELFPALYDGEPAILVLRPATGDTRRAVVLACGTADELASATIPAP